MAARPKIKIVDDIHLRADLEELYKDASQVSLAKWSLSMAKHILKIVGIDYESVEEINNGFRTNELWQSGDARMHEVRLSGFAVHKLARESNNEIYKTALRVVGQAIGSGHMREHSMVASDYAIKVIGLITSNDKTAITNERKWQLNELKAIIDYDKD